VILQIQDNGNDLEEEGGDDSVEIDDMLFDELDLEELDLSGLLRRLNLLRQLLRRLLRQLLRRLLRHHYDSYCNGRYNSQDGCCDCSYDSTTKARPPEGLKGQRAQEEEAEGYWWW